ncbi:MAG: hypothetical protein Ct9H90mP18_07840 [Gammaproteobacteria bacterium]|nr:MAG: hypothetical protein Ct9H90mP18_07840 [Gammaproteobacteria bacterium]
MTLTPTNFSGRGLMIEGEFRHKSKRTSTEFEFANLDKDDVYGENRHAYFFRDNRVFSDNLKRDGDRWLGTRMSSSINIGGISDLSYFDDFGNTVSRVGRTHITKNLNFNELIILNMVLCLPLSVRLTFNLRKQISLNNIVCCLE